MLTLYWQTVIAIISAITAILSVYIGRKMYLLSLKQHQDTFNQWIAVNEPWLRISFEYGTDADMAGCSMQGYPSFIRIQNQGKLPCIIEDVTLGNETLHGRLRHSSLSESSIGGVLKGARFSPGETIYFRLSNVENLIKRLSSNGEMKGTRIRKVVPINVTYKYEPERRKDLTADVKLVASKKWTLLRVVDSTVKCIPAN